MLQTHKLLVSCCNRLGALYVVDPAEWSYRKVMDTPCCGIAKYKQYYVAASFYTGIMLLDRDFHVVHCDSLRGFDYHGAAVHNDYAFIVETMTNAIRVYELPGLKQLDEIRISDVNDDIHHVNDVYVDGDRLFVSMFSLEGPWRPKMHTPSGGIAEYSLTDGRQTGIHLANQIHHPHSVQLYRDRLLYCSSYDREVRLGTEPVFRTDGYPRGLAVHDSVLYIGNSSSANRQGDPSQAGVYEADMTTGQSRFLALPSEEVYGIIVV